MRVIHSDALFFAFFLVELRNEKIPADWIFSLISEISRVVGRALRLLIFEIFL